MKRDYYEVLGIARDADDRTIKRAYRKLAMDYHPDRNPGAEAEEKFKEASEAYEVLSDSQRRQTYDRGGFDGLKNQGFSGFSGQGVDDIFSAFGDMFGDMFGFGRGRGAGASSRGRGADLQVQVRLSFEEAAFGCKKDVPVRQRVRCDTCKGSGAETGSQPVRCRGCAGRGQVVHGQGVFLVSTVCPECNGAGSAQSKPCKDCRGDGRVQSERTLNVNIPAGFDDGMALRCTGEGEPGRNGGPAGDLYVAAAVAPHDHFKREGDDVMLTLPISFSEAALGASVEIDGLQGKETVRVPGGSQPEDVVTLSGRGVPRLRGGGRGDLHALLRVEVPRSLNHKQKELLKEFAASFDKKKRRFFG